MEKHFHILRKCPLFSQIKDEPLPALLTCLGATVKNFAKKETILEEGRSGLSSEISKLRKEGVLKSEKKHFELL